eukprot:SAG31_NODE_37134_length_307_cov_0.552885_2_plen_34_part_01
MYCRTRHDQAGKYYTPVYIQRLHNQQVSSIQDWF